MTDNKEQSKKVSDAEVKVVQPQEDEKKVAPVNRMSALQARVQEQSDELNKHDALLKELEAENSRLQAMLSALHALLPTSLGQKVTNGGAGNIVGGAGDKVGDVCDTDGGMRDTDGDMCDRLGSAGNFGDASDTAEGVCDNVGSATGGDHDEPKGETCVHTANKCVAETVVSAAELPSVIETVLAGDSDSASSLVTAIRGIFASLTLPSPPTAITAST